LYKRIRIDAAAQRELGEPAAMQQGAAKNIQTEEAICRAS
jgi:hypothetical protein